MTYKLPEGWIVSTLEEALERIIDYRGRTPKKSDVGIPTLSARSIKNNYIDFDKVYYISEEEYDNFMTRGIPEIGDVVITTEAPLGLVAQLKTDEIALAQRILTIRGKTGFIDNGYLKYYFQSSIGQHELQSRATGTTVVGISQKNFRECSIIIPPIKEQEMIGDTLSALDNKIELNNKINENLEQQAQSIFKHWFVDFQFPDKNGGSYKSNGGEMVESEIGMIPRGWEIFKLGDKLGVELGGTPARKNEEYWGGNINWINSGELNSYRIIEETERITELGLKNSSTKLWPENTTVIAITGATLGKTSLLLIETCANQSVVGIKENNNIPYTFVYPYIISKIPKLTGQQTGGAQQHINKGNIEDLRLLVPDRKILYEYDYIITSHYKQIETNEFENVHLSKLRDTLLPKLMSGELRIPLD